MVELFNYRKVCIGTIRHCDSDRFTSLSKQLRSIDHNEMNGAFKRMHIRDAFGEDIRELDLVRYSNREDQKWRNQYYMLFHLCKMA